MGSPFTSTVHDGWRAFLAVPLLVEETCLGALFLFDRGMRVLNRNALRLAQAIGRQIGPLVKNAELFDELQWQHRINQASLRELERSRSALRSARCQPAVRMRLDRALASSGQGEIKP